MANKRRREVAAAAADIRLAEAWREASEWRERAFAAVALAEQLQADLERARCLVAVAEKMFTTIVEH